MHRVAVEEHHRAGLGRHGADAALLHQQLQADRVRHAVFLFLQRLLVVLVGRLAHARDELAVRAGHQHQRAVALVVVGQQHRAAQRAHGRHAVFDVPGFKVGVPVELLALEARLHVGAGLVDVDLGAEDLARHVDQPRIAHQARQHGVEHVHHEDGAHRVAARLGDGLFAADDRGIARHALDLGRQRPDLVVGEQVFQQQEAVALVSADLLGVEGVGVLAVLVDHRVLAGDDGGTSIRTRGVRILCR